MGNILDLIITSAGDLQVSNAQSRDVGLTDHYIVSYNLMHRSPIFTRKKSIVTRRNLSQIDIQTFTDRYTIARATLSPITQSYESANVGPQQALDDFTTRFHSTVVNVLDELAPVRTVIRRQPGPGHIVIRAQAQNAKARRRWLERLMMMQGLPIIVRAIVQPY